MKTLLKFAAVAALGTAVLYGQNQDTSGDSMLKGAYRFRQVAILNINSTTGSPSEIATAFGVITFDGAGNYTIAGTYQDPTVSNGAPQAFPAASGATYAIGNNGLGYVVSPVAGVILGATDGIFGSVAQGVFTGSDTETGEVNDIFIAIPVSTAPTNASFKTAYSVGLLDFTGGVGAAVKNALFNLTPNGAGGLGTITLTGQAANQSAATITQTVTGATYNFGGTSGDPSNATLNIPLPSGVTLTNALFVNAKSMYVSSDGNFVLGWTPGGSDVFFGVSALTAPATNALYQGTYYLAGLDYYPGYGPDSYYGSALSAAGNGTEIVHQRLELFGDYAYDSVNDDSTQLSSNGTTATPDGTFGYQYAFGDGGKAFVAIGTDISGSFSLVVGTQAPVLTGSGVFLNPVGIFNSASYAPITASIAPGELLTLFGTGLSQTNQTAVGGQPFQNSLGGVQVLMNGEPSPIYYVTATQIATVVPYGVSSSTGIVTIQVNNNGQLSDQVAMYLTDALPGIFTQNETGTGLASVLHNADYSLVTTSHPAVVGEYIDIYLTGLGTVTPVVADGAVGPGLNGTTLSYADQFNAMTLGVNFDDYSLNPPQYLPGTVAFAGLAPGFAGLYQISVQVPTGVDAGDLVYLEVYTDAADVNQVQIPIGGAAAALAKPQAAARHGLPAQSRRLRGAAHRGSTPHPQPPVGGSGLSRPIN